MDFTEFKNLMERLCAWRIPGNSVSVYHHGKEIFKYSAGYSDLENKIPMNGSELLNIYSCSKVVTVTAALQLYEKGYFLLDDPLYDFFPEYRKIRVDHGTRFDAENPITLRHLFTMTSGLSYKTATEAFKKSKDETGGNMDTLTVIRNLAADNLSFEPGERWQYGLSHDVLAGVVEVISGKKFRDYVRENIFEPLEMHDSFYHNEAVRERMAKQYRFETPRFGNDLAEMQAKGSSADGGVIVENSPKNSLVFGPEYDSGGAGITCTVGDFSKFAQALALGGKGINGERILSPGTVELLRTNQLSPEQQKYFEWKQHRGYGYGLGVRTLTSVAASGTTGNNLKEFGWGGAAGATVIIDADEGLSMFYAHHMLNPQEEYYQPRIRNVLYTCMGR